MDLNTLRQEIDTIDEQLVRLFCQRMGCWGLVGKFQNRFLIVEGGGCGGFMAAFLSQKIYAGIGDQPVQPCGEAGLSTEEFQPLPRCQKGLLSGLLRVGGVLAHPPCQGKDPFFIKVDQLLEGQRVAVSGGIDPDLFLSFIHFRSRLIPFVT